MKKIITAFSLLIFASTNQSSAKTNQFKIMGSESESSISESILKDGDSLLQAFKNESGDIVLVGSTKVDYGFKCFISAQVHEKKIPKLYFLPDSKKTSGLACDDVDAVKFRDKGITLTDILISAKSYQQNRPEKVFRSFYVVTLDTQQATLSEDRSCNDLIYADDSRYWKIYNSENMPGILWLDAYLREKSPTRKACL